jgi:DNA polymerase-3 subunit delta
MAARSTPAPVALQRMLEELERGWPGGLTLLTGDDLYHLDRAQKALLESLVPQDAGGFGLTVYGDQRVEPGAVVAAARSVGMFSARRVVLVRDVSVFDGDPDPLAAYAADPPRDSYIVVRAPAIDRRRKLYQVLARSGKTVEFVATPGSAAAVAAIASAKDLPIDREAAGLLAELCGGDFYRIDAELEKIRAWIGEPQRPVDTAAVREVAAGSGLLSGWEMGVAIGRRDRRAALVAARRILDAGTEPLMVVGGLAFKARGMFRGKALLEQGVAGLDAVKRAGLFGDDPRKIAEGLARYSPAELLAFPRLLLDADRTLKSRGLAPRAVLESLVDRMMPERTEGP